MPAVVGFEELTGADALLAAAAASAGGLNTEVKSDGQSCILVRGEEVSNVHGIPLVHME